MSRDLAVVRLEREATPDRGYRQQYTMGETPLEVSGLQSLVQTITIGLLSEPRSHALDLSFGVDIRSVLKVSHTLEAVRADSVVAISRLREQVTQRQAGESMPDDERLADLSVERVFQDGEVFVIYVQVVSASGAKAVINSQDFFV